MSGGGGPGVEDRLRRFWDRDAHTYDRSPTHAAADPLEAAVWRSALLRHLPPPPAALLDAGAGTGALSLLAAELGYTVTALDLSPGMLARARAKAAARGLDLEVVVAPADRPPPGPFDVVVERHLLWTLPDPVAALRAWCDVTPRLVAFEGIFGRRGLPHRLRGLAAAALRRALRVPPEHHGSYDPALLQALPLAGRMSPEALVDAASTAGWERIRVQRLRDVEWARRRIGPRALAWVETVPHFALLAERPAGSPAPGPR